jgi:hypothetical protein
VGQGGQVLGGKGGLIREITVKYSVFPICEQRGAGSFASISGAVFALPRNSGSRAILMAVYRASSSSIFCPAFARRKGWRCFSSNVYGQTQHDDEKKRHALASALAGGCWAIASGGDRRRRHHNGSSSDQG